MRLHFDFKIARTANDLSTCHILAAHRIHRKVCHCTSRGAFSGYGDRCSRCKSPFGTRSVSSHQVRRVDQSCLVFEYLLTYHISFGLDALRLFNSPSRVLRCAAPWFSSRTNQTGRPCIKLTCIGSHGTPWMSGSLYSVSPSIRQCQFSVSWVSTPATYCSISKAVVLHLVCLSF